MGVPITSYSLAIGQEHVEFAEAKIQARIITKTLDDSQIDALAAVSVAGMCGRQQATQPLSAVWFPECAACHSLPYECSVSIGAEAVHSTQCIAQT